MNNIDYLHIPQDEVVHLLKQLLKHLDLTVEVKYHHDAFTGMEKEYRLVSSKHSPRMEGIEL